MSLHETRSYTVYYSHVLNERTGESNLKYCPDYVCCVNASSQEEAIEKTKLIALNQPNARYIKIVGIGYANLEWVNEKKWMETDPNYYREQAQLLKQKMEAQKKFNTTW